MELFTAGGRRRTYTCSLCCYTGTVHYGWETTSYPAWEPACEPAWEPAWKPAWNPAWEPSSATCKSVWKPHAKAPRHCGRPHWYSQVIPDAPRPPWSWAKCSQNSARALSGAPESTCSYGGAFKMLRDLTYRIVKFWSSCDFESSLRPLLSSAGDLVPYSHSCGS